MKKKLNCEIEFFKSPHLNQIYYGFDMLKKQGIISLRYKKSSGDASKGFVKVIINKKYSVIYDALDGLNWVDDTIEKNIDFFSKIKVDFYFKRSYTNELKHKNLNLKLYPLGFNYYLDHKVIFNDTIKNYIKNSFFYKKVKPQKSELNSFFLENKLAPKNKEIKIFFFTRLWDPEEVILNNIKKKQRESINLFRIKVIKICKKEFGSIFEGGLIDDKYSREIAPELIIPKNKTSKMNYLKNLKQANICIATTGLHNSSGWKIAEYLASSQAIISQPLEFKVPGDFKSQQNYLEFNNEEQLVENINLLLNNSELMTQMMKNNYNYYNNFVRPDKLILNSLSEIKKTFDNNI